jgi:SNF2 family DNA or RNA helicase
VVLDEGQLIKNRKTPRTIKIKELNYIPVRLILTGTPTLNDMTKSSSELWSLLNFLYPEQFNSYWRFVDQHCVYHEGEVVALRNPDSFKAMLSPIMLRRLKEDVLTDLPPKTYMKQYIELYPAEKKVLKQLANSMEATLSNGDSVVAPLVVAQILRMKQCCVSSRLLSKNLNEGDAEFKSAKLDAMLEIIQENMAGHKIVVFSQFYQAIRLASDVLYKAGIVHTELTGKMSDKQASESLERFKNDKRIRVKLATIKAAGVGVDGLQVADVVIFLDQDWTPGINTQAEDRLHRNGQKGNVTVIKLIAEKSVEVYIEKLLEKKAAVFEDWIDGSAKLSASEIRKFLKNQDSEER